MKKHSKIFKSEISRIKKFFKNLEKAPGCSKLFQTYEDEGEFIVCMLDRDLEFKNYHDVFYWIRYNAWVDDNKVYSNLKDNISNILDFGPGLVVDFKSAILLDDILTEAWLHYCSRSGGSKRTIKEDCVLITYQDESDVYTKDEYVKYIKKILKQDSTKEVIDAFRKKDNGVDDLFKDFIESNPILKKLKDELNIITLDYFNKIEELDKRGEIEELDVDCYY